MSKLVTGHYGLVLFPDRITEREILRIGSNPWGHKLADSGSRSKGTQPIDPVNIHFTLYHTEGLRRVNPWTVMDEFWQQAACDFWSPNDRQFSADDVRVHKQRYVLWHAQVSSTIQKAHTVALSLLAPHLSREYRNQAAADEKRSFPLIRDRDLELVQKYGRRNVDRLNQPHFLCGTTTEEVGRFPKSSHHGCFTHVAFTRHDGEGIIKEILIQEPLVRGAV